MEAKEQTELNGRKLMNAAEIARETGIPAKTIRKAMEDGHIRFWMPGREYLGLIDEVLEFGKRQADTARRRRMTSRNRFNHIAER